MRKRQRPDFKAALGQPIRTCDIEDIRIRLEAPFHPNEVDWRVGASAGQNKEGQWTNQAWAYIDARDVQRRLDCVVGFGLWDSKIRVEGMFIICDIKLKFEWDWVLRSDGTHIGDVEIDTSKKGSQNRAENREFEKTKDNTVMETKGSYSIAFKRAAVKWGIGPYLYELPKPVRPTDAKTRQFSAWSLIEFWMIAAHSYAEYREEVGKEWGPEEKGEDFALWTRRKYIDLLDVVDHHGNLVFDTPERLAGWCKARGMDPDKVPMTRKRSAQDANAGDDVKRPEQATRVIASSSTHATMQASAASTSAGASTSPAPIAAPLSTPQSTTTPPADPPATTTQAPAPTASTTGKGSSGGDDGWEGRIKSAVSAEDVTTLSATICALVPKGLAPPQHASALMDLLYQQFMELVQIKRTISGDDAKTVWKIYHDNRKKMDPKWDPPKRNAK